MAKLPTSFVPDSTETKSVLPPSFIPDTPALPASFVPDTQPALPPSFVPDFTGSRGTDPLVVSERMPDTEIQEIARTYGVDSKLLRQWEPLTGVLPENANPGDVLKTAAGFAGNVALGIPQKLARMSQNPQMEAALDELFQRARAHKSYAQAGAEMLAPALLGPLGGAAKVAQGAEAAGTLGRSALVGAGIGAGAGFGESSHGEELKSAAGGAAGGAILGAGGHLAAEGLSKLGGEAVSKIAERRNARLALDKGADEVAAARENSEGIIHDLMFGDKEALSPEEVDTIVKEQYDPEELHNYLDPSEKAGSAIRAEIDMPEKSGPRLELAIKQKLADEAIEQRTMDFAEELTKKKPENYEDAVAQIDRISSTSQGEKAVQEQYDNWIYKQHRDKFAADTAAETTDKPGFWTKAADFFSGNQFVLRHIDDRFGVKAEDALRDATAQVNQASYPRVEFKNKLDSIDQLSDKLGVRDELTTNPDEFYRKYTSGQWDKMSPEEQQVAQKIKDYTEDRYDFDTKRVTEEFPGTAPLSYGKLENYLPEVLKDTRDIVNNVSGKLDEAKKALSDQLGRPIEDLSDLTKRELKEGLEDVPALQQINQAMQVFDKTKYSDPADFSKRFKQMFFSRDGQIAIDTQARSALERKGGIPDWMLEKNVFKILDKSTNNNIRHIFTREPIDRLRYIADSVRKAGGQYESEYIKKIIQDFLGVRKGTYQDVAMQTRIGFANKIDKMIDAAGGKETATGAALNAAKAIPDVMASWARSIFPNVLGYRIRPLMMHASQSATKLWPELGATPWSAYTVLRGATKAALDAPGLIERAEQLGNVPSAELMRRSSALVEGIQRSNIYKASASAISSIGNAGMYAFEKLVRFNRAIAVGTADVMSEDLVAGSASAQKALQRFPANIQRAVNSVGTAEEKSNVLAKYLNATTMYNYDKLNKSEFGRTMGPMFSAFSTWPTNTLGDIVYEMRSRGVVGSIPRNMEKYVAPWALLYSVDQAMRHYSNNGGDLTDREKVFTGAGGLGTMAPIGSLGALIKGEAISSPVLNAVMNTVIHPIMTGDVDKGKVKAMRGLASTLSEFGPNAGLVSFVTDSLPTLLGGQRPEGTNFIERTQEGAAALGRKLK